MCLILLAVNPNDRYRLIVAANRDELYARPTKSADYWQDHPEVLAGIDENMGGTWLGVNRQGRFAAVTNFREDPPDPLPPRSRGDLPIGFLKSDISGADYLTGVSERGQTYRGFNLLLADSEHCYYFGNRSGSPPRQLDDGCYGLSNQLLDCDWPKVIEGRSRLTSLVQSANKEELIESLFETLLNKGDDREFSNSFIASETYGTRAATVVLISHGGDITFEERNFAEHGAPLTGSRFTI
jgi:uncharacterized protein with NRDE domain